MSIHFEKSDLHTVQALAKVSAFGTAIPRDDGVIIVVADAEHRVMVRHPGAVREASPVPLKVVAEHLRRFGFCSVEQTAFGFAVVSRITTTGDAADWQPAEAVAVSADFVGVAPKRLRDALNRVLPAASRDATRRSIWGSLFRCGDGSVSVTATNGHILVSENLFGLDVREGEEALAPLPFIERLDAFTRISSEVRLGFRESSICAEGTILGSGAAWTLTATRPDYRFPDFRKVLPNTDGPRVSLCEDAALNLAADLKTRRPLGLRMRLGESSPKYPVTLIWGPAFGIPADRLRVSSPGLFEVDVPATVSGSSQIGVSAPLLLHGLDVCEGDVEIVHAAGEVTPSSPTLLAPLRMSGSETPGVLVVMMPMRHEGANAKMVAVEEAA